MNDEDGMTGSLRQAARALQAPPPHALPANFAASIARQALAPDPVQAPETPWFDWLRSWWQPRVLSPALQFGWAMMLCVVTASATLWGTGAFDRDERVYVRFAVDAPAARSVSLAGDFNDWDPTTARLQPAGVGKWEALVPLTPGVYQYMFVIDGQEWILDPAAIEQIDDGFGQHNSLMRIRSAPTTATSDALDFL